MNGVVVRSVRAGVSQGSVLGPLLWNIGYDRVLRGGMKYGCQLIWYADDTLLASANVVEMAVRRANLQVARVLLAIGRLGLKVATKKTKAVLITNKGSATTVRHRFDSPSNMLLNT